MKTLKKSTGGFLICLFEIIIGILLLIEPVRFTTGIIIAFGTLAGLRGLLWIARYFASTPEKGAEQQLLFKGLTALLAGLFCILRAQWIVSAFPILTLLYGAALLLLSLNKVQWMMDMLRAKKPRWFLGAVSAGVSLVCAVLILLNPFASTAVLWIFTAVTLIAEAIFDIAALFITGR